MTKLTAISAVVLFPSYFYVATSSGANKNDSPEWIQSAVYNEPPLAGVVNENFRMNVRRRRFKALLVRGDVLPSLSCTLVDVSETGARLVIDDTNDVPEEFTIVISQNRSAARRCRLIWRGSADVGVAFETNSPLRIAGPVNPELQLGGA